MADQSTSSPGLGLALARAAAALLRVLGGYDIQVLVPAPVAPDSGAQLGLVAPVTNTLTVAPAAVRSLSNDNHVGRLRVQFLFAPSVMEAILRDQGMSSVEAFFNSAIGIVHEGRILRVEKVDSDVMGGVAYLYRVTAVE